MPGLWKTNRRLSLFSYEPLGNHYRDSHNSTAAAATILSSDLD